MRTAFLIFFAAFALTFSAAANADQWCTGKVTNVYVNAVGTLNVKTTWRNDYIALCNINMDRKGISAKVCATWFALASQSLKTSLQTITMYSGASTPACAVVPTYDSSPAPYYFMSYQ